MPVRRETGCKGSIEMLSIEEKYLDQISEMFDLISKGNKPDAIHLPEDYPE